MKSVKSILVAIAFVTLLFAVSGCAQSVEKVELERRIPLCEDSEMALQMSCSFDWPLKGYNQSSLRAIQRNIIHAMFPDADSANDPEQAFLQWCNEYKTEYRQCCLSKDTDYESFLLNWESAFYGKMNEPYNGIVSYVYDHYTYTGGAHGGTYRGALNMDEKTGRILTESDIFEPENYQILTSLVREYLPKCTEMDMIDDPAISPSSDFYITSEGITYIYQQYEIGPYALGIVEVLIPWSELTFLK
jgi:hypothetical protein